MCEPVSISAAVASGIGLATAGASTGLGVADALNQRQVLRNRALIAARRRRQELNASNQQARDLELEAERYRSAGVAAAGASGVSSTTGTVAGAIGQSHVNAAIDASRIRNNAALRAWGFEQEEEDMRRAADQAAFVGVTSSVLSGAAGATSSLSGLAGPIRSALKARKG